MPIIVMSRKKEVCKTIKVFPDDQLRAEIELDLSLIPVNELFRIEDKYKDPTECAYRKIEYSIVAWRGFEDANGKPASLTFENIKDCISQCGFPAYLGILREISSLKPAIEEVKSDPEPLSAG